MPFLAENPITVVLFRRPVCLQSNINGTAAIAALPVLPKACPFLRFRPPVRAAKGLIARFKYGDSDEQTPVSASKNAEATAENRQLGLSQKTVEKQTTDKALTVAPQPLPFVT